MLQKKERLSRSAFKELLKKPELLVVYNPIGTLKFIPHTTLSCSVVTSSRHEKRAVVRNRLRRRIYAIIQKEHPTLCGILYVSKTSYALEYTHLRDLLHDLLKKTKKYSK